ncbi:MFS transporter, DHA2 family, multidrug resistance protein [Kosakonia arachidis]|uniref:MFS transporter, DHA2 family, multidrug resistance protein n=1 Tax=Kosakonia arachidis TaxID=551989 RepID=A0A1I6ZTC2_9ENTR|nr:MFS transporter [Kosakonia arachidis]SFT65938.1 MFS transporter, DHA2 family, multidrug resistance protein [Kosakonia arachidis]
MELFTDRPGDEGVAGKQRALALIALMTSTTMAVFDGTMVNIALPQIARALQVSAGAAVWVANGYLLSAAMTLAIFAALAARMGFRTLFASGLLLFTVSSLGCALSSSLPALVTMRVLQGIGGAATLSIAPAILRSIFPTRLLGRILGINALLIATSTAIAPVIGGALLSALGWQWLFAINIPLGAIALVFALRVIPGKTANVSGPFDVQGALFSALMLGAAIMASTSISYMGTACAMVAVASGLAFVRRQRRAPQPLLPLGLFASPRFSLAALTSLASFISQGVTVVALPFLFQNVYGYSTLTSALLFTAWPVGIILVAPHAGRLADRYAPAKIATAGLLLFAVGLLLLALLPQNAAAWDISLRGLICGMGFGCFQSPNNREMLASASREHSGYASGVLAIVRTFGQCFGAALVGVMLALCAPTGAIEQEALAIRLGLWLAVMATLLAITFSLSRLRQLSDQAR